MTAGREPLRPTAHVTSEDVAAGFDSGVPALDAFFAKHALENQALGLGVTYVLRRESDDPVPTPGVLGFYTLAMANVPSATLLGTFPARLPRYPAPVALIGRLAVDRRVRGRGLGENLLLDAFGRILEAARVVGCLGVIVDAKDPGAEAFYERYGLHALDAEAAYPRRMFVPIETIREAIEGPDPS